MCYSARWPTARPAAFGGCPPSGPVSVLTARSWKWVLMPMDRLVEPEWLDELPVDDPRALRSRQDLRRVNVLMGHARILSRRLRRAGAERKLDCLVDLGAGGGTFSLELVTRLAPHFPLGRVVLVDRQRVCNAAAVEGFKPLGR